MKVLGSHGNETWDVFPFRYFERLMRNNASSLQYLGMGVGSLFVILFPRSRSDRSQIHFWAATKSPEYLLYRVIILPIHTRFFSNNPWYRSLSTNQYNQMKQWIWAPLLLCFFLHWFWRFSVLEKMTTFFSPKKNPARILDLCDARFEASSMASLKSSHLKIYAWEIRFLFGKAYFQGDIRWFFSEFMSKINENEVSWVSRETYFNIHLLISPRKFTFKITQPKKGRTFGSMEFQCDSRPKSQ